MSYRLKSKFRQKLETALVIVVTTAIGLGLGWLIAGMYGNDPRCMVMTCIIVK